MSSGLMTASPPQSGYGQMGGSYNMGGVVTTGPISGGVITTGAASPVSTAYQVHPLCPAPLHSHRSRRVR